MLGTALFALALAPQVQALPQEAPRSGRPEAPYSLPPVSGLTRPGHPAPALVPPDAPPAVPEPAVFEDDGAPLPIRATIREGASGDVIETPASGDPFFLGFAAGSHHPPVGETVDAELYTNALPSYSDGRPSPDTYAFVMFEKRMTPARLAQLEALGCRTLGYHPHYTQKVALPATAVDQVAALDFVRWVGVPQSWQKVHPALTRHLADAAPNQPVEVWVSVFESDVGPGAVNVAPLKTTSVTPLDGQGPGEDAALPRVFVTNGWQHRALELAGLELIDFNDRARVFRARMLPEGLDLVTALDFVQFVELDVLMKPMHDESMPMVNGDDLRAFHTGGDTAVVGMVDSGVEISHQDLGFYGVGTNLSGASSTSFDDDCGHGTHVAGTILGEGNVEAGHRGAAPELGDDAARPFYSVRVFSTCAPQSVDVSAVLGFLNSATPVPHVVNNSWGSDPAVGIPWIGSETSARLYDDAAYYDAQLHVCSVGNAGPGASTVGLPAAAKNVLTVGNVTDYDGSFGLGTVGEIWTSSSRGPTADGRWKPNLVAPGNWITSADAFNFSGYTGKSGSSMAAPHVTGIAADMLDAFPTYTYLPERVSSILMATATRKDAENLSTPSEPHLDDYGAGRVDGTSAIWDSVSGTRTIWTFSLNAGGGTYGEFTIPLGATRLVAVMHYVEESASAGASTALVNDWDFYLDQPPITTGNTTGEWFAQQSSVDNTEIRTLPNPLEGTWRWKLHPENVTSLTYFCITIFVETGDTSPTMTPFVTSSVDYARPFDTVRFDYALGTPGMPLSAVFLEASATASNTLLASHTYLRDGTETDLMDNQHSGWDLSLGNVHPFFWRNAAWELEWSTEGNKTLCVQTNCDNAANDGVVTCKSVLIDGTLPTISFLSSPSHGSQWSNDPTVDLTWSGFDPLSVGTASGIDGYSQTVTPGTASAPPKVMNLGAVSSYTTPALADGVHWFNLRPVDKAGNWGGTSSLEAKIDTQSPSGITGLASTTHQVGVSSCDATITFTWDPATDNGPSGVAGYGGSFSFGPGGSAPTSINTTGPTFTYTLPGSTLPWYFHVRAIDNAGNGGPQTTLGPFPIDQDPASVYCTAKTNSQGCVPTMTWTGTPKLSGSTFTALGTGVLNNKVGLLFWGYTQSATPFQGGTKCVASPTVRTPTQNSGGNPPPDDCSGTYSFTFDSAYMNAKGIGVADTVHCQYWSRDPSAPWTTGLTNGLSFTVCP